MRIIIAAAVFVLSCGQATAYALVPLEAGTMATEQQLRDMAGYILSDEGRFDRDGNLKVYRLPAADRGGTHEVAGINNRYHPAEYAELVRLLRAGRHAEARRFVEDFMISYTDVVLAWDPAMDPGVEYALRDMVFNRGPTGAARILQLALGVAPDGRVGPETRRALKGMAPAELLKRLRVSRETYERRYAHRSEKSALWRGLVNRWDKVAARAAIFHA